MLTQRKTTVAKPAARFENLVVTETADEVLLYDTDKHHIHHLNATTAAVWRLCDGKHTVVDLAREAGAELGAEMDEATVRLALTKLDDAGLLKQPLIDELRMSRMSRRTFMQRAGVAGAIAVPAIVSTTAATSARSPSCLDCAPNASGGSDDCLSSCPICTGICQTGQQFCTGVKGYTSHLCTNSDQCKDLEYQYNCPTPGNPNKMCTQSFNCSGTYQVPGVDKGCCVKNTDSGSSQGITGQTFTDQAQTDQVPPDQTQTDQVPPDQTQTDQVPPDQTQTDQVPPDQTQTDQVPPDQTQTDQVPAGGGD